MHVVTQVLPSHAWEGGVGELQHRNDEAEETKGCEEHAGPWREMERWREQNT